MFIKTLNIFKLEVDLQVQMHQHQQQVEVEKISHMITQLQPHLILFHKKLVVQERTYLKLIPFHMVQTLVQNLKLL